ncbi:MAG TPA: DegV family protein [Anaerolineae bacterium]
MNSVRIVADSGCDLPPDLAARHAITIVPCIVRFGEETISDAEITLDEFWVRAGAAAQPPGTSAPPPRLYQQAYQHLVDGGHDVLCLTLPHGFSTAYNTAWLAAQDFGPRVAVMDSGSFSLGMGVQALAAARDAVAGLGLEAIRRRMADMRRRTSVIFALDTIEWARRGGRIARVLPLIDRIARTFQIKPVVEMIDGDMRLLGVARSYHKAVQRIEEEVRQRLPIEVACTAYTRGCDLAAGLSERLSHLLGTPANAGDLVLKEAGPTFAAHAGPGAVGAIVVRA